jgi:predicted secreted hydrolase
MTTTMRPTLGLLCAVCVFCPAGGPSLASENIPALTPDGFRVPQPGPVFAFPRDHGSHPDYKIEWWYLTGHLFTAETPSRRFGFQATFFRSAAPRDVAARPGPAAFGHDQIYLAHMALIDVATGRFLHQERLNRAGWDAAASTETLDVRNGDWSLALLPPAPPSAPTSSPPSAQLHRQSLIDKMPVPPAAEILRLVGGVRADARFTLEFTPSKPLVRFGEGGYSRKGAAPIAASYYLTFPRLAVSGSLTLGDAAPVAVTGQAWMDHEYSSSQLDENQVGWDWLSAQLHDGRELMFYALRRRDGGLDPASTLTWIDREGRTAKAPWRWEPLTRWRSPRTGAIYPNRIRLTTTDPASGREAVFIVAPFHADQELGGALGGVTYWEGACRILAADGATELGSAYMELTGYDKPVDIVR